MNLQPSDVISSMALLASIASAYYTKNQISYLKTSNLMQYRGSLAEHHQKYSALLNDVRASNQSRYADLSSMAGNALNSITSRLDCYDSKRGSVRPLRHVLGEAAEMVALAFNGQLAWQREVNLSSRLSAFIHLEDRLQPSAALYSGSDFRQAFRQRYFDDPNRYEDQCILSDLYFCNLVQELKDRIPPERRAELLLEITALSNDFLSYYQDQRKALSESGQRIEAALDANASEQFHLGESGVLYTKLKFEMRRLNTLSNLYFPRIDRETASKYLNYTSMCIYVCALLDIVQRLHSWGWDREMR
jgi:hypothetical protein